MFNNLQQLEKSDYNIYFLAQVVENNDPLQKGRIKVRVPNLIEENYPWVNLVQPVGFGSSANAIALSVPAVDSIVMVFFERGDLQFGFCVGTIPTAAANLGPLAVNYPNRYGFVDPAGNSFYVDTTEGSTEVEFKHKSGTTFKVLNDGTVEVDAPGKLNLKASGDTLIQSGGNLDIRASGRTTLTTQRFDVNQG